MAPIAEQLANSRVSNLLLSSIRAAARAARADAANRARASSCEGEGCSDACPCFLLHAQDLGSFDDHESKGCAQKFTEPVRDRWAVLDSSRCACRGRLPRLHSVS